MAYPPLVRQDGFQLPSPAQTTSSPKSTADDDRDDHLFMSHNIPFLSDSFRKFQAQHPTHHQHPIDFADELATLIETPHVPSHERSTQSGSPNGDAYRHTMFDIAAQYQQDYPHFNPTILSRYEPQHDTQPFQSPSPTHRSRSRSRAPSVGPTRSARRDRRANSISSHVSSTSPPPRPHPHAILIPGRGNSIGGFFVPNGTSAPPDYNLPTPDSLSHSIVHQFPYPAQAPSSPYYTYQQQINRPGTPNMGISPTDVETLNMGITAQQLASSLPSHVGNIPKPVAPAPSSVPATKSLDPETHLSEKRRRRRESHNAVERRRRDNINERIGELASLIPGVLFECDGPLAMPGATGSAPEDLFALGVLGEPGVHVLPTEDGLPDLPEESTVKKDPGEEGEALAPMSPTSPCTSSIASGITINGNEQSTIKANKGMILRKSVEYIRYLQQLVSVQASRGRDLEERNRALERELAMLRGDVPSSSPSVASSQVLSMSSRGSASSKPSSVADSTGLERCGEDLEMEDACVLSLPRERDESRGRRLGRTRDKTLHGLAGMDM